MDDGRTPDASGPDPASGSARRKPLILASVGALTAVGLGVAVALGMFRSDPADEAPPPAAEGGLRVELGQLEGDGRIDPARPLRCFVEGRVVGELTLAECAKRNGVAAQALDVGVDAAGELAAAVSVPPINAEPIGPDDSAAINDDPAPYKVVGPPAPPVAPEPVTGSCQRHTGGEWRELGDGLALDTCVQLLFTGRCESPGSASYGRWNGQTVRLVTGRVEIAPDGATFRTLVEQDASCMLP
jgi:hypothetical protein